MCKLSNSINIPLSKLSIEKIHGLKKEEKGYPIYVLCRRGVDSRTAVRSMVLAGVDNVYHIEGGLCAWSNAVDSSFPTY